MGCKVPIVFVLILIIIVLAQKAPIVFAIFCIIFGILGFFVLRERKNEAENELSKIKDIDTFKVKDIIDICNNVKEEMGKSGYFNMIVAVEGFITKWNISLHAVHTIYVADDTGKILVKPKFYDKKGNVIKILTPEAVGNASRVYIVGEASDISGELMIQQPKYFNNPFVIALKSKQEHIKQRKKETENILGYVTSSLFILAGIIWLIASLI